jgi:excisionase family DNA binding protein
MAARITNIELPHLPAFDQDRLTRDEAARFLGVKFSTLENDAVTHRLGVPFYKIGKRVYYRRSELAHWIETRRVAPVA